MEYSVTPQDLDEAAGDIKANIISAFNMSLDNLKENPGEPHAHPEVVRRNNAIEALQLAINGGVPDDLADVEDKTQETAWYMNEQLDTILSYLKAHIRNF